MSHAQAFFIGGGDLYGPPGRAGPQLSVAATPAAEPALYGALRALAAALSIKAHPPHNGA